MSGKLIVIYGVNNLGKTTQAKLLVEKLKNNNYPAEYLKYPIYDLEPSGKIINNYLREGNIYNLTPREFQIMQVFNRTQFEPSLKNKLNQGINIIAEDYIGTGLGWGIGAGVDEKFLTYINSHLLAEDLVFLLDGERFTSAIEAGHNHEENLELTKKVREALLKIGAKQGWKKINANQTVEEIQQNIWEEIKKIL